MARRSSRRCRAAATRSRRSRRSCRRRATGWRPAGPPTCSAASSPATPWCSATASASRSAPATRPLSAVQQWLGLAEVLDDLRGRGELPQFGRVADTRGFADAVLNTLASAEEAADGEAARVLAAYRQRLAGRHLYDAAGRLDRAAE